MTDWLAKLIEEAAAAFKAMSPVEKQAMHRAQMASFIRAEAGFGSDADEAEMREALASGDVRRIEAAKIAEAARLQAAEAYIQEGGLDQ